MSVAQEEEMAGPTLNSYWLIMRCRLMLLPEAENFNGQCADERGVGGWGGEGGEVRQAINACSDACTLEGVMECCGVMQYSYTYMYMYGKKKTTNDSHFTEVTSLKLLMIDLTVSQAAAGPACPAH